MRGNRTAERGRGLGPFTGGQLTIIIVAICAVFVLPTAARAAAGAFTVNSTAVPALKGTNTNGNGIGVAGVGKRYGVWSNGPLGVAPGKPLSCDECVTRNDIEPGAVDLRQLSSNTVLTIPELQHQESQSGPAYLRGSASVLGQNTYVIANLTFSQPLEKALPESHILIMDEGETNQHCFGVGFAEAGYLCFYVSFERNIDLTDLSGAGIEANPGNRGRFGIAIFFPVVAESYAQVDATYTVTGE